MGMISSRQLPMRFRSVMHAAARASAEVCCVGAFCPCRVPTVGLHDKTLEHRDRAALRAAKKLYSQVLPALARPVAPPLALSIDFVLTPPKGMAEFAGVLPYTGLPDLSNLLKLFEDALRHKGWMVDDREVQSQSCRKWISFEGATQGVRFTLATISVASFGTGLQNGTPGWLGSFDPASDLKPYTAFYIRREGRVAEHR